MAKKAAKKPRRWDVIHSVTKKIAYTLQRPSDAKERVTVWYHEFRRVSPGLTRLQRVRRVWHRRNIRYYPETRSLL